MAGTNGVIARGDVAAITGRVSRSGSPSAIWSWRTGMRAALPVRCGSPDPAGPVDETDRAVRVLG